MSTLAQTHDALLLDLDGTVYLGDEPIDHVAPALRRAAHDGAVSLFITNNASRPPAEVAEQLIGMGITASAAEVLTSPQAAAAMLAARHPAGAKVLVVGAPWLSRSVEEAGLRPVHLATDEPVAVVQGHSPDTGWRQLAEACIALRTGADWVACNNDTTLPTDRGLLPGNGAMVAALVAATGRRPRVAGKPERPMLDEAVRLTGSTTPLVVGDRLDTDIAFAHAADAPSLMVLTGVSSAADLLAAPPGSRPTYLAFDLRGLVDEDRAVRVPTVDRAGHLEWTVDVADGALTLAAGHPDLHGSAPSDAAALRALALLAAHAWAAAEHTDTLAAGVVGRDNAAVAALQRAGLPVADGSAAPLH